MKKIIYFVRLILSWLVLPFLTIVISLLLTTLLSLTFGLYDILEVYLPPLKYFASILTLSVIAAPSLAGVFLTTLVSNAICPASGIRYIVYGILLLLLYIVSFFTEGFSGALLAMFFHSIALISYGRMEWKREL